MRTSFAPVNFQYVIYETVCNLAQSSNFLVILLKHNMTLRSKKIKSYLQKYA